MWRRFLVVGQLAHGPCRRDTGQRGERCDSRKRENTTFEPAIAEFRNHGSCVVVATHGAARETNRKLDDELVDLARYVLVDAENETQARELGQPALHELYADLRERLGREVPINILTRSRSDDGRNRTDEMAQRNGRKASTTMNTIPKPGDRIRLIAMPDDPHPDPAGFDWNRRLAFTKLELAATSGFRSTSTGTTDARLMLSIPPDEFELLK